MTLFYIGEMIVVVVGGVCVCVCVGDCCGMLSSISLIVLTLLQSIGALAENHFSWERGLTCSAHMLV